MNGKIKTISELVKILPLCIISCWHP